MSFFIKDYGLLLIVIVNSVGIAWAMLTWSKGLRQTWMNDLRDTGSLALGAASHWHVFKNIKVVDTAEKEPSPLPTELRVARANYELYSNKLLMLFSRGSERHIQFNVALKNLRGSLEGNGGDKLTQSYYENYKILQELIHDRIYEEWDFIKGNLLTRIALRLKPFLSR